MKSLRISANVCLAPALHDLDGNGADVPRKTYCRRCHVKALRSFAILLLSATVCLAGPNRWTTSGPGVATVSQVYVSPIDANTAFVRTAAGLFKSSDGGRSWRSVTDRLPSPSATAVALLPDGTLFIASGDTIYRSDDAGEHWAARGTIALVTTLAFDPASNHLLAGTSYALLFSDDGGVAWKQATMPNVPPGILGAINTIVVSADAAYASFDSQNVMRSTDGGQSWSVISTTVLVNRIFANGSTSWVYASTADGSGLIVSKDGGKTWTDVPSPTVIYMAVPARSSVFIATSNGAFVHDDGANLPRAIGSVPLQALAVSNSTPRHFYGAPPNGMVAFVDGDSDWITGNAGLPGASADDVDVAPIQPSTAYATTDDGIFRTDDAGQSWTRLNHPVTPNSHVAASPATPNTAYAFGSDNEIEGALGAFKTVDAGSTWNQVSPAFASAIAVSPSDPKTLYGALASKLFKSGDEGRTWTFAGSGIPTEAYEAYYGVFYLSSMAIDRATSSHVLIGRDAGVYRTTDGGSNWKKVSAEPNVRGLTIDILSSSTVFGGRNTTGVIKSTDSGESWQLSGLTDKSEQTIAQAGSFLFAGTSDGHIYRSGDGGSSWTGFDDGASLGRIMRIAVDPSGTHLYAATPQGVYSYEVVNENIALQQVDYDPRRFSALLGQSVIVPAAGTVRGAAGALYTTQLTLSNGGSSPQNVLITRVPRA